MKIVLLSPNARAPVRSTPEAAGLDLFASTRVLVPGISIVGGRAEIGRALVPTGIAVAIPADHVGRLGSRSGLSVEHNIEVGAGWIDPDYRGEIRVELKNFGSKDFWVEQGTRIAQLFVLQVAGVSVEVVDSLPPSERMTGGFGSTGLH